MRKPEQFTWCAERLRAIGDPDRLKLIVTLLEGPKNVGALVEAVGEPIVKVSHHLGVLRNGGIVQTTKQGRFVLYALHPEIFAVANRSDSENYLDLGCCRLELPPTI